jgi:A/G-specific adenine glycosylase
MSATFTMPNAARRRRLVARLVAWYSDHARDLPWRRTSDPYAIWISESMLQQTRVEAVIDYWTRFLERFPTIEGLANAQEDDVLTQWSGLGYYRRARSLHAAAKAVVADHGGRMPSDGASLRALPGIGPYTVGAIRSIAFDQPAALVDGNVERVFARLFDLDLDAAALKRQSWELAESLVPEQSPGAWNQALMELGATVCTPRSPRCEDCPVARSCAARSAGTIADRPRPKVKLPPLEVALELAWASDGDRILLVQRPTGGRMAEMWELPTREIENAAGVLSGLFPAEFAGPLELDEALTNVRHSITKHRIRAVLRRATGVPKRLDFGRLVAPDELAEMPLTGMTRKVLGKLGS